MNIRVERKDGAIITIDVAGDWRVDPVELHRLVGRDMQHVFTPDGYYDHSEPRPRASAFNRGGPSRCRPLRRGSLRSLRFGHWQGTQGKTRYGRGRADLPDLWLV
jgi:hypothetical protein